MRRFWLAAVPAALLLSGCMSDQKIDFASCRVDSLRTYPVEPEITKRASLFVQFCMISKGYEMRTLDDRCNPQSSFSEQLYCWAPVGWFGRSVRRMELVLGLAD
jgi:hypothetical protein